MVLFVSGSFLSAQEGKQENREADNKQVPLYTLGDQMLCINGGLFVPLFFQAPTGAIAGTNLSLGGVGSLQWASYLNNNFNVGIELSGMFAFSPNMWALFMVPITVKASYVFRFFPFELPIYMGVGPVLTKYKEEFHVAPILKPGFSFYWMATSDWSFGLNIVYWWIPQIYTDTTRIDQSRFGNFLEASLSALYHFK